MRIFSLILAAVSLIPYVLANEEKFQEYATRRAEDKVSIRPFHSLSAHGYTAEDAISHTLYRRTRAKVASKPAAIAASHKKAPVSSRHAPVAGTQQRKSTASNHQDKAAHHPLAPGRQSKVVPHLSSNHQSKPASHPASGHKLPVHSKGHQLKTNSHSPSHQVKGGSHSLPAHAKSASNPSTHRQTTKGHHDDATSHSSSSALKHVSLANGGSSSHALSRSAPTRSSHAHKEASHSATDHHIKSGSGAAHISTVHHATSKVSGSPHQGKDAASPARAAVRGTKFAALANAARLATGHRSKVADGSHKVTAPVAKSQVATKHSPAHGAACGRRVHRRSIYNKLFPRTETAPCDIQFTLHAHGSEEKHTETIKAGTNNLGMVVHHDTMSGNNAGVYKLDSWGGRQGPFIAKKFDDHKTMYQEANNLKAAHQLIAQPSEFEALKNAPIPHLPNKEVPVPQHPWLVMKHVEGAPLTNSDNYKAAQGITDAGQYNKWAKQKHDAIVNAVIDLHKETGLLHGDIKHDNIHWQHNEDGSSTAHLLDFGNMKKGDKMINRHIKLNTGRDGATIEDYARLRAEKILPLRDE